MKLSTRKVEKVWGRDELPSPFEAQAGQRIGEIWFEPPEPLRELLIKYIFTSEKLSIQCHPSDAQTRAMGLGRQGKEECWLVIDADPGATLGIGFRETISAEALRAAALDGSIEELLVWHPVRPGDFFYIPANTVHAIGGGCSIIEVQQNSDITYRLYDYGRPRELHLDEGVETARGEPYDLTHAAHVENGTAASLVEGPHFRLDLLSGAPDPSVSARYAGKLLVLPRNGEVMVAGEAIRPGECALADAIETVRFAPEGGCLIAQPLS